MLKTKNLYCYHNYWDYVGLLISMLEVREKRQCGV